MMLAATWAQASEDRANATGSPVSTNPYVIELSTSLSTLQGVFNSQGEYNGFPDGSNVWAWVTSLGGSYHLSERLEAGLYVPFRQVSASLPTVSITSTSILGPLLIGKFHLDGWANPLLHAGVSAPPLYTSTQFAGNPMASLPEDIGDSLVSGISVPVGVSFSHGFGGFQTVFDATYTFLFANQTSLSDAPPGYPLISLQLGNRLKLTEGLSHAIGSEWNVSGGLGETWTADTHANGMDVPGTAGQVLSATLGTSFSPDKHWRYSAKFETVAPFYSLDVNQIYGPSVSLAVSFMGL